ncbi:biotin/lipoyl-containing protein [Pseudonocardia tropica]|uniref:Biotin carboxyl carrier protein of acetyl-CoA carboxylase n=1 Tax=Pseudonocardia tropica TaxID=681289 RepID=A0ABV1K0Y0_9PSEU
MSERITAAEADRVLEVLTRHARELVGLGPVRLEAGGVSLDLSGAAAPIPVAAQPPADAPPTSSARTVTSEAVGVFYRASGPDAPPFVAEGDVIEPGRQIGIVEVMKLMIPVEATLGGRVEEFLVADGEAVEHGQPLLRLGEP